MIAIQERIPISLNKRENTRANKWSSIKAPTIISNTLIGRPINININIYNIIKIIIIFIIIKIIIICIIIIIIIININIINIIIINIIIINIIIIIIYINIIIIIF